jgi:adenine deaminase
MKINPGRFPDRGWKKYIKAKVRVIGVQQKLAETEERIIEIPIESGRFQVSPELDLAKISVFDRHNQSGNERMPLSGFEH